MMITIKNDGTIEPLGLKFLRESNLQLMAPTRNITDSSDEFNGEIDFGTELKCGNWVLVGATDEGLTAIEKMQIRRNIATLLNNLRTNGGGYLNYESDPDKKVHINIDGRAEVEEYPSWLKVRIPLKVAPFWISAEENTFTGNAGSIINNGTEDISLVIELKGPDINPEIIIGNETLKYFGTLLAEDTLTINTEHKTVKFNDVNALGNFVGEFPQIQPGKTAIEYLGDGVLSIKWHDCWI